MAPERSNRLTDLGELQLDVLEKLSHVGSGTVYDVLDQFPEAQRPRYTTLLTVLRGLERKGLVSHSLRHRAYGFTLAVELSRVRRSALRDVLDRVFGGSARELVSALLDEESVTPEVVEELKALLARKEGHDDSA